MTPNPTFRAAREAAEANHKEHCGDALCPSDICWAEINDDASLISERFRKLCTAAENVLGAQSSAWAGHETVKAQRETLEALREALKEVL